MKVTRTTGAVMLAAGALTVLGFAGTALADGSDDTRPRTAASASASVDPSLDDSSASPDDSGSPAPSRSPSSSPSSSASSAPSSSSASSAPTAKITASRAKTIALRAAGGGRIESLEREREHGRLVWEIDVIRDGVEHDIDVDATTGEVTRHRTDD